MVKRFQETKTGEEVAVAEPRPTCLVSRNLLSVRQTSSFGSDASDVPGKPQLDSNSVQGSTWKQVQFRNQNPATNSQERQQDQSVSREHMETCAE